MASQDVEETVIQCGLQTSPPSKPILVLTARHAEAEGQTGLAKGAHQTTRRRRLLLTRGGRGPHVTFSNPRHHRSPGNHQSHPLIEESDEHFGNRAIASRRMTSYP